MTRAKYRYIRDLYYWREIRRAWIESGGYGADDEWD